MPKAQARWSVLVALLSACTPASRRAERTGREPHRDDPGSALTIPPGPHSLGALRALERRADRGDVGAAWLRAHYLLDLFDAARFAGEPRSRAALFAAIGAPAGRGPAATDRAVAGIAVAIDRVVALDRLHPEGNQARTLLHHDARPPAALAEAQAQLAQLKTIHRGGGPLSGNAALRLASYCSRALHDALRAPFAARVRLAAHCLVPLYDADPAPYLAADPAQRPPPPDPLHLVAEASALVAPAAGAATRLAPAFESLRAALQRLAREHRGALPRLPMEEVLALRVPAVDRAQPYDWAPLWTLGTGADFQVTDATLKQLRAQLQADRRGRVTVALAGHARAATLQAFAEAAGRAGAHTVELLVSTTETLNVPPHDYWSRRSADGRVGRPAVIELRLSPAADTTPGAPAIPGAVAPAALELYLQLDPARWQLLAREGQIASLPASSAVADPRVGLGRQAHRIRSAFPQIDAVAIAPAPDCTIAALVAATTAIWSRAGGSFARLTLVPTAPRPRPGAALRQRIGRRARARVQVTPAEFDAVRDAARLCYQSSLERDPSLTGVVYLEIRDGRAVVARGPRDAALSSCIAERATPFMVQKHILSATVALTAAPPED
jgi:hypothetical protein